MASFARQGNGSASGESVVPRIGHVYLDVRNRVLHYLNVRAKQLHNEGVPFLPRDLQRCPVQTLSGEPVQPGDLPLMRSWQNECPEEVIFLWPRPQGPAQQITWNTAPMRNPRGEVVGVFGSVSLTQPEPDWQALAGLAHDLRTPLQALKLLVALLEGSGPVDANTRAILDRIRAASDRALNIGLDLLEWCRGPIQGGRRAQPTWFALEPFLFDLAGEQSAAAQQKSLLLVTELAAVHGWEIYADRVRLSRLLSNLLVNAIRYTTSGSVQFRAEWRGEGERRTLALGVVDTGVGISPEEQESIFQPFERGRAGKDSDSGGSGLGLAVVERLVEELGLELDVYSEYGRGSAFHLLVPMRLLRQMTSDSGMMNDEARMAKEGRRTNDE
ncbi:MAG TPA: HAMP domain-containing sensor histidine kinase [Gemmataceae bacterium]|nr:HAMP domain-containing sensor histidine kinase [Gemmataceae bacterium]